uniref:Uncharacterized protein n=1 Tax=Pseudomonas phage RVTF4 TaxID=3236931 RepID=A0AB39CCW1_9VIRU
MNARLAINTLCLAINSYGAYKSNQRLKNTKCEKKQKELKLMRGMGIAGIAFSAVAIACQLAESKAE